MTSSGVLESNLAITETVAITEVPPAAHNDGFEAAPLVFLGAVPLAYLAGAAIANVVKNRLWLNK